MTAAQHPSDWKVVYGDRRQFTAYFGDRGKADHYAFTHGGFVIPLYEGPPVKVEDDPQRASPSGQ